MNKFFIRFSFFINRFKLYSFQLQDPKEPCISIYCHCPPKTDKIYNGEATMGLKNIDRLELPPTADMQYAEISLQKCSLFV
jgi:hypothetical protein